MAGTVAKFPSPAYSVNDDHYVTHSSGVSIMEQDVVLDQLYDQSFQKRADILDQLRQTARRHGGRLPFQDPLSIFQGLSRAVSDTNWDVRHQCINLINELIPKLDDNLDKCMTVVLPKLIPNLGDSKITIRKAVIQTVHVYMKYTSNIQQVFHALVQFGLENEDFKVKRETTVSLPMLFTKEFESENLLEITQALAKQLVATSQSVEDNLTQVSLMSIEKIRTLVGDNVFDGYIQRLPVPIRRYYCKLTNRKEENGFDSRTSSTDLNASLNGTPRRFTVSTQSNVASPRPSGPSTPLQEQNPIVHTPTYQHHSSHIVEMGIIPSQLMERLNNQEDFRARQAAIEELKIIIGGLQDVDLVIPHMMPLVGLLNNMLDDKNFRISVTTMDILDMLVVKLGSSVRPFSKPILNAVCKCLNDNKIVVRQSVHKVARHLMTSLSPKFVLSVICEQLGNRSARIRQEALNIIIAALLTFPSYDFDLPSLCQTIGPTLVDSKRHVRQASLECFGMLAQAMGAGRLQPLVQAVDSVELSYEGDGVMAAVQARLARRQLPRINSEGLVEYATTLPTSSQKSSSSISASQGADIDWIMQAAGGGGGSARSARSDTMELESVAGSARSTPAPALESPGSTGPSPRRFLSAGRDKKKLPWAEEERDDRIIGEESGGFQGSNTPISQGRPPKPITESTPPPFKPRSTWGEESIGISTENQPPRKPYRRQTSGSNGASIRDQSPDAGGKSASSYKQIYLRNKLKSSRDSNDSGTEKGSFMSSATSSPARSRGGSGPVADSYPDDTTMFNKPYFPSNSFGGKEVKDLSSSWPDGKRLDFDTKPNKPILDPISAPETPNFPEWPEHNHPLESLQRDHYTQDSRRDVDPLESPIPLKPTLARGSASKRHKVPPLSERGSARRDDDEKDSGRDSLENTLEGAPNPDELNTSLRSIRTSAKRKVEKLFEKLETQEQNQYGTDAGPDHSNSSSPDYLLESGVFSPLSTLSPRDEAVEVTDRGSRKPSNKKSDSPFETKPRIARMNSTKEKKKSQENLLEQNRVGKESPHLDYNPNSGVTFKENPNSDVKVIGRGYAEDATPGDVRASQIHSKAREKRRLAKGPVLSPLGMASMYSHGAADPEEEPAANGIGVVGRGMFDHSPAESGSDQSLNSSVHKDKRKDSRQGPASPDLPVFGVGMRQNSSEKQHEEGLMESDDESVISMSKTTKERLEQKREERIKEAEEKKARKEHERRVREAQERREREERIKEQKEREARQREEEKELQRIQEEKQQKMLEEKQKRREEEKQKEKERQQEKLKKLATEEKLNVEDLSIFGNNAGTPNKVVTKPPAATPPRRKSKSPPTLSNTFPMSKERKVSSAADHSPPATLSSSMRPMSEAAELKRCSNPDAALKDAQAKLAQDDWNEKCDGLSLIRRLAQHHPATLAANLHPVNVAVMAEVRNLRSQVSRLAITTLGEMFQHLKRNMDTDLENTSKVLLHKNGESNGFIREDCEKALANMIAEVTPQRALLALIQGGGQHKNPTVRRTTSQFLVGLVERMGPGRILSGVKDTTDRVLPVLAQFATDGSPETRYNARKILFMLMSHQDFDKCLTKYLPQNTLRNIQEVVDGLRQKGLGDDPNETPTARSRRSGQGSRSRGSSAGSSLVDGSHQGSPSLPSSSSSKKRGGHRVHMDEQTQEEIKEMNNMLGASDWKQRHEGLNRLMGMCEQSPEVVGANITKVFDKFVSRLNDSNSKVNLYALQVLLQITPLLKDYMGSCINMVIQTVSSNLSSKNKEIYNTAMDILDSFMEHLDEAILLQPFANQAQAGNVRVKPDMIEKVAYLVTKVYPRKQKPVMLHVLPLLWHLLGAQASSGSIQGGTGNTQTATARLVASLYQQMGQSLLDQASSHLAPRHMQTLHDMIQNQLQ